MTDFVDYDQILDDLVVLLQAQVPELKYVAKNMPDHQRHSANMPGCDVTLNSIVPTLTGQNNYYTQVVIDLDIGVEDLSGWDEAATIRNDILNKVHRAIQTNPRFSGIIETSVIGPVEFERLQDEKQGLNLATAVAQIYAYVYADM
jgi:hypothetical protein